MILTICPGLSAVTFWEEQERELRKEKKMEANLLGVPWGLSTSLITSVFPLQRQQEPLFEQLAR